MARRPNYSQQRAERDRAARSKSAEKAELLRERTERRKQRGTPDEGSNTDAPANDEQNPS